MVQVKERVGAAQNGSMNAVAGSGMASMSDASMDFQPRMLEPSKPKPSSKTSSVSSPIGQEKCCQVPKVSTNFTSTILAPCFLAISMTPLGVPAFADAVLIVVINFDASWFDRINSQRIPVPTTSEGGRLSLSDGVFALF